MALDLTGDNSFWRSGDAGFAIGQTPVLLSVPHSGRNYPDALLNNLRVPSHALQKLEDRYADLLISEAVKDNHEALSALAPRAWIDLNRHLDDLDRCAITGIAASSALQPLPKVKWHERAGQKGSPYRASVGLGLVPTRLNSYGDLWRDRWAMADIAQRIEQVHAPYHQAIAERLDQRLSLFGCAILLDIHSMPSLPNEAGKPETPVQILFGDRFGASAPDGLISQMERLTRDHGFRTGRNRPYAGGYILDRHNRPDGPIYAVQVEVDRALYLDRQGVPGRAIEAVRRLIAALANVAADYAYGMRRIEAAE
ncbi:N-formylglutamate amidohydrolase [Alterisphingorhabdus coralli]|uniref:N-formylglutamate amidohydrolase n=1 Tax=Alterisphingorhabdus coralli TaxID=3071408 RepID=A0AA97FA57_9SPHN|nr:N-formylglutamate amidohydrolase [Parasphingorhabdus sp. SCSIO 66989]WOE76386.1 N-formylglutamate amidohydrolase [Parasphingorhabdus sp. SCSIO 66989]